MFSVLTREAPGRVTARPARKRPRRPRQWRAVLVLAWYGLKAQLRNPGSLFFGFLFPILFVAAFGLLGQTDVSTSIGIPADTDRTDPVVGALTQAPLVKLTMADEATLEQQLRTGKIDAVVRSHQTSDGKVPTYSVTVVTSTANRLKSQAALATVRGVANSVDLQLLGASTPPVTVVEQEVSGHLDRYIDFALPGQIGFALLSTAVFSTTFGIIFLKKSLVLKRMFATPVRGLSILLAQGLSRLVIVLWQAVAILVVGVAFFHFDLPRGLETFGEMLVVVAFGLLVFLGIGLFIAGLTADENGASPIANLITLPQFLLSGTFFPTDVFPSWLQPVANNLPLSFLNTALRKIANDGATLDQVLPSLLGLAAWGVVAYLAAARTFKWE